MPEQHIITQADSRESLLDGVDDERVAASALPSYPDHILRGLSTSDLVDLMVRDEDRVPLNVIEECARRSAEMESLLAPLFAAPPGEQESQGHWCLRLHALNILGLIPSASAGTTLVRAMLWLEEFEDLDLQDTCSGYWPAWLRNKPDGAHEDLQRALANRSLDTHVRADILECLLAAATRRGPQALDEQLDAAAYLAADDSDDADLRYQAGYLLLDFPRERHKPLLMQLANARMAGSGYFEVEDIDERYDSMGDEPQWLRFDNPLMFYSPEEIQFRQQLRHKPDQGDFSGDGWRFDDTFEAGIPYVREAPKVGRNDPCPCGSGKKYKKCCVV